MRRPEALLSVACDRCGINVCVYLQAFNIEGIHGWQEHMTNFQLEKLGWKVTNDEDICVRCNDDDS